MASIIKSHYNRALARHSTGESATVMQDGVAALAVGGLLGLVHAKRAGGLDAHNGKVPIDMAAGILTLGGSLFIPGTSSTRDVVRTSGAVALGVGTFRHVDKYITDAAAKAGATAHGESNEDPIIAAARAL